MLGIIWVDVVIMSQTFYQIIIFTESLSINNNAQLTKPEVSQDFLNKNVMF